MSLAVLARAQFWGLPTASRVQGFGLGPDVCPKAVFSGRFVMGALLHVWRCGGHADDWQAL